MTTRCRQSVVASAVTMIILYAAAKPPEIDAQQRTTAPFYLRNAIIPLNEIHGGGPPKDGIPAITDPTTIEAVEASYLNDSDPVVGVAMGDEHRAYPLRILVYHEIVNDTLNDIPIAVTYCPLCYSIVVFDRRVGEKTVEFGVSGLLYNSNVLMYDREGRPESLWSQMAGQGVSGPGASRALKTLPVELTTWRDWQTRYPNSSVLSNRTGYQRDYQTNPYRSYFAGANLMFPVRPMSRRLSGKTLVLGVWSDEEARAYPLSTFAPNGEMLEQELDGKRFQLVYDDDERTLRISSADEGLQWMYSFWFAWYAFRPHTEISNGPSQE